MSEPSVNGQIVAHHGVAVEVAFRDGSQKRVRVLRRSGHVVGDEVTVIEDRLTRLPRRSVLHRRAAGSQNVQVIAANLTHLGIVVVADPPARVGFIDRAMVLARVGNMHPFVVVNKLDLPESRDYLEALRAQFGRITEIFGVSAKTEENLGELQSYLEHQGPSVFIGPSGVGKSSLTNGLIPDSDLATGALSQATGRGRHTTSTSTLHQSENGIILVDTPGVRDYGLIELTARELAAAFPGFEHIKEPCHFRNCKHTGEPGCAVESATNMDPSLALRLKMYRHLLAEMNDSGGGPKSKNKTKEQK